MFGDVTDRLAVNVVQRHSRTRTWCEFVQASCDLFGVIVVETLRGLGEPVIEGARPRGLFGSVPTSHFEEAVARDGAQQSNLCRVRFVWVAAKQRDERILHQVLDLV